MPADLLIALIGFAVVTSITPGPNNLMLLSSGVNFGFRPTIPHMLGIGLGFGFMLSCVGLGIGALFASHPAIYQVLRAASIAYMLWLAWKIATAGPVAANEEGAKSQPMTFLEAALFQWINPKAWAMALTSVAAYSVSASFALSLAIMVLVFIAVCIPSIAVWTAFGVVLRTFLQDSIRVRIFNVAMAVLLVASLWPLMAELAPR